MANTKGEKELRTDWEEAPSYIGKTMNLLPQGLNGIKTTIRKEMRKGLD